MPFDPKLIHPDDAPLLPGGELALPDELAHLAEQLRDDAAHLASRYPAESFGARAAGDYLSEHMPARNASWVRSTAIAGALLASVASLVVSVSVQWFPTSGAGPTGNGLVRAPSAPNSAVPRVPLSVEAPIPSLVPATTTLSLGELSGPEREALLDLWHSEGSNSAASVSF
jgi:hypothetical protein